MSIFNFQFSNKEPKVRHTIAGGETPGKNGLLSSLSPKGTTLWIPLALLAIFILSGCTKKQEPTPQQADSQSENTQMRIISMAPNLTEILFALGLNEEIVGVTRFSTYPPQAKSKTNVGTFWQPDIEAVLMCRPTLVLTLGFSQQTALAERLKQIGCETLTVNIESVDELYSAIQIVGDKIQKPSQAQLLIQRLQEKQKQMAALNDGRQRRKVLWVIQREPLCVAGTDTFINELIEIAGGVNAVGPTLNQYPRISTEEVLGSAPDVIIEPVMDPEQADMQHATAETYYKRFGIVPAVKNGRIYVVDGDMVSRLGPRLDQALVMISQCIWEQ